jgi:hypothetical protein
MPLPLDFIAPCLATKAPQPPTGGAWLHEIKHYGFHPANLSPSFG